MFQGGLFSGAFVMLVSGRVITQEKIISTQHQTNLLDAGVAACAVG